MTYSEACKRLADCGIENYKNEARILIEELCGEFSEACEYNSPKLISAIEKRCEHYPLQYIIGKWWFCRCTLEVNENCLIPRPDTELIVELAQKLLPKNAKFADLCTGSGCIAIAILDLRQDTVADAYDLYPKTLAVAQRNSEINNVSKRFFAKLGNVLSDELLGNQIYSAIISNPPYIRSDVIDGLSDEVHNEPRAALDGGDDGLIFYRAIIDNFEKNLDKDGFFLFEIGFDQAKELEELAAERGFSCKCYRDLGGCDRAVVLKRK